MCFVKAQLNKIHLTLLGLLILIIAKLTMPLEALCALYSVIQKTLYNISSVYVDGAECYKFLAVVLAQWPINEYNEVTAGIQTILLGAISNTPA